jgi:hypothetical protein
MLWHVNLHHKVWTIQQDLKHIGWRFTAQLRPPEIWKGLGQGCSHCDTVTMIQERVGFRDTEVFHSNQQGV